MSLLAILATSLHVSQLALQLNAQDEQNRLDACLERIQNQPSEAYEDSLAWLMAGNRPKARHCNAMALISMGRVREGATRLEALANAPDPIALNQRIHYMTQAGNAWLSANYPEAAITAFSTALRLQSSDPFIYVDRAAAYFTIGNWALGLNDLDAALSLAPDLTDARALRARAYLKTEALESAKADIDQLLIVAPENIEFLLLRGEINETLRIRDTRD
ncbi:MAG: Uncharacterised protein [Hyphomonas sp. TMED17]|nr:MAG: Uncharacterised protein [Hyphomonas sp. TMED17]